MTSLRPYTPELTLATAAVPPTREVFLPVEQRSIRLNARRPLLLYVEDECVTQCLVEATLRDAGYDVQVASDGFEALDALATIGPALGGLMTDVDLGECPNGWQVARAARDFCPMLPVLYVSGASANDWQAEGVDDSVIVEKPFTPNQIVGAMALLCATGTG